jgi:hypothetical protein
MTPERRKKLLRIAKRITLWGAIAIVVALVLIEIVARVGFGLGDPPLTMYDADMEYRFQPSQRCRQFGHDIAFNAYSMRCDDFPKTKSSPDEFRVMVIGDSIVYGGTQVDQNDLASGRMQRELREKLKRPVVVGNIAAGSWGPPNELAYVKKFGLFDADVVVIVLTSIDANDVMRFDTQIGEDPNFPVRKPRLVLWGIATRYAPRFFAIRHQANSAPEPLATTLPSDEVARSMAALRELIHLAHADGARRVIVAQHWDQREFAGTFDVGHEIIKRTVESTGEAELIQLGPAFKQSLDHGEAPYRDFLHPSPAGQGVLARVLDEAILAGVSQNSSPPRRTDTETRPTTSRPATGF